MITGNGVRSSNEAEQAVQPAFRRASFCASTECIEVGQRENVIILRDSARPEASLHCGVEEWRSLLRNVKAGAFDVLRP